MSTGQEQRKVLIVGEITEYLKVRRGEVTTRSRYPLLCCARAWRTGKQAGVRAKDAKQRSLDLILQPCFSF